VAILIENELQLQFIPLSSPARTYQEPQMPPSRLRPVYRQETPITELRVAEAFIVTALRLWAAPHRAPGQQHGDWRGGFIAAGIDAAGAAAFDGLFRIVLAAARRPLDVRCHHCPRLGADEAWLLQLVMLLQRNRRAEAAAILADWLPPAAARMAMMPAFAFASALAGVGLVVPLRHCEAAEIHHHVPAAQLRGCELVH
jgi:hypothetical protein